MSGATPAHVRLYRPAEVAELLGCSQWWVKDQARRRRIPFCWIGGSYRFTEEHIAAIVRLFEVQPVEPGMLVSPIAAARNSMTTGNTGATVLVARVPRRARAGRRAAA